MERPIVVAQATGPQATLGAPAKVVTVNKPLDSQAVTIHLDGKTTLNLTSIANEQITLVHLGDRLIILFDNHAQVTLEPFYGDNGQPLPDLTVELAQGRDVTGADFAGLFPISTDQSVLPAAGDAGSPSSGGNFNGYSVDPLTVPGPLPLLGPEEFGGTFTAEPGAPLRNAPGNVISLTGGTLTGDTFEGGLLTDTILTVGNHPGEPTVVSGPAGSLNGLVDFGPAGPGATPFQFVSVAAAETYLSSLGLTSQGMSVDHVTIVGNTLTVGTDPAQTGQPTNDPNPHDVFSLTIGPDGSITFTLLGPLDDANPGHLTPGPAVLDQIAVDLSGFIQAVDALGNTLTLSHDVIVNVHDDAPVLITAVPSDVPDGPSFDNTVSAEVDETALSGPASPGDLFDNGNGGGTATVTGQLNSLVAFGADGPDFDLVHQVYDGFQLVSQGNATTWLNSLDLQSHGAAVDFASVSGNTLTAWTGGGPSDPNAHEVFSLTINGDGSYSFTLINPLDHPEPGHATPAPEVVDTLTLDLSGFVQAVDFDGDSITLSGDFSINVVDDVPILPGGNDDGSGTFIIESVDEGGLTSGTPGDLFGSGNDPGAGTSATGNLSDLGVQFGADGPDVINGNAAAYRIAVANNSTVDFGVQSHGVEVDFVTVTDGPVGPHGTSQTLTAWTDGGPDGGGHEVFTLTVNGDGSFTFNLINSIDHPITGSEDVLSIDLSTVVEAVDFDGDALVLPSGTFEINVTDDVPVATSGVSSGSVDEGGLLGGLPGDAFGAGNDQGAATSTTVSLSGLVSFGADGPATPAFQFVDQTIANTFLTGLNLSSHGQAVDFAQIVGNVLTAWTGGGPLDPSAHAVFSITLNSDQTYTFQLINPLDHPDPSHATPGPAVEDTLTINLAGLIQAVDFDQDPVTLTGSSTVTITDDVPVATGNLIQNGDFTHGNFTAAPWGGLTTTTDGSGGLDWILAPSQDAGANAAQPGFLELERVNLGYLGTFMPNGDPMVDMDATPGDIQISQQVHGVVTGQTYQLEFWTAQSFPPGTGELEVVWNGQVIGTITPNSETPSPHLFTVVGGSGDGSNTLTFEEIGTADNFGTYLGNVSLEAGTPVGQVDEGGLTAGVPGDLFGDGNDPGAATVASGSISGLVSFGADGPDIIGGSNAGFQFALTPGAHDFGVSSHGQEVDFFTLSAPVDGPNGVSQTLTAFAGGSSAGTEVFTLTLNGDGTYTFTLINPLDHGTGLGENTVILDLSVAIQAVDYDGDTIQLPAGSFRIDVTDDVPVAVSNSEASATVDEGGLTFSSTVGDLFGDGNDHGSPTSATVSLSGSVHFGADGPGGFQFVDQASANTWLTGLGLASHGQAVDFASISGNVLTAWTGTGPTDPNAHAVFSVTLNSNETLTFDLINPLDHPDPGHATPGPAVEDSVNVDLSGLIQAVDFDGDTVTLSGGAEITIIDDVPVLSGANEDGSGTPIIQIETVDEGALTAGTPGDLFGSGNDVGLGPVAVATGTLAGDVSFGADGPDVINGNLAGFQLNVATGAHDFGLTSHGVEVDFITVTTVGGTETLTAYAGGSSSGTEVFTLVLNGDGSWTFTLINPIDHPTGNDENVTSLDLSTLVQAVDFDGDIAPPISGGIVINIVDDVPVLTGSASSGAVDEGGLKFGLPILTVGDFFGSGNDPGFATSAAGSLATIVSFGADGPQSGTFTANSGHHTANVTETIADGFQFVSQSAANAWLSSLGLTSHDQSVNFATISTALTTNGTTVTNVETLTAWTNGGPFGLGHEVFTLSLNVTTGAWSFQLVNPIDHPTPNSEDSVNIDLSGLVNAIDFDGDALSLSTGTPSASSDFTVTLVDDVPVLTSGSVTRTVDEGGLTGLTDTFGSGNDPHAATSASGGFLFQSGSLNGLVHFGADGPALAGGIPLIANGFQFAVSNNSTFDFGVKSHGVEVDFVTLSAPIVTLDGESQTLTAFAGNGGPAVFTLTLNGDGSWVFHLLEPIDDAAGHGENSAQLDLSGLVKAVDFDGDSVVLSGDFKINVTDDVPVATSGTSSGSVDEGGLTFSASPPSGGGDLYGDGNDHGAATSATVSLSGLVSFGADGPGTPAFQFVDQTIANTFLTGLNLSSHGQAVDFAQIVGNVLTAWTGGGPSDPGAHAVFSITLNSDQTYTFQLINPLDHPDPSHATPGPAIEDTLTINLAGLIQAVDFDQDPVTLTGSSTVTITDDVPVATGNLIQNGDFTHGNFTPQFYGGVTTTTDGSGGLDWILAPSADAGANAAQPGFVELERVNLGYLGTFMPNGDPMVDMDATPGDIQLSQQVHGVVSGQTYQLEFWTGATIPPGTAALEVFWGGQLIGTITPNSETPAPHLFTVVGGAGDGSNTLTFEEIGTADTYGTYLGNVSLEAGTPVGQVDEGGLVSGTPGDLFGNGNDPGAATVASGTIAGLVSFGADGPDFVTGPGNAQFNAGFQFALTPGAHDFGVSSHGNEVNFLTLSAPVDGPNGVAQTLTAYTGGSSAGIEVFTLTLNGDGTYTFTLINPLDHGTGLGENSLILDLSVAIKAVDYDGDTIQLPAGSFRIDVTDDVPVALGNSEASATVDEGALTFSSTAGDLFGDGNDHGSPTSATVSLSGSVHFGADGAAATPFQFVDQASANTWLTGLGLTSHGQAVDFASISGNVLTAWTGGGPGDLGAHIVFSVTLNSNETLTFDLINPIDHPDPGHATPGAAVEDAINVDLSGLVQAVDFDGDTVTLSGGAEITITDDVPVAQGNLVHNGNFAGGNFTPAFWGGTSTTTDGSGGLDWILAPSADAGNNAVQPGLLELERINPGYLGTYMPNGDPMVDMDATPGDIQISQHVNGVVNGESYQLEFWTAQTFPPGTGALEVLWGGQVIETISATSATPTPHLINVVGGAGDGSNTLTFEEIGTADTFGTYVGDVSLEAGTPFGIVDEGGLTSGTPGDLYDSGNDPGAATSASGNIAGLVGFGADGPDFVTGLGNVLFNAGFRFALPAGAHDFGVSSHGNEVNFFTLSAPVDGAHGVSQTLTAYTGGSSSGTEVFTLTINGDGTWNFQLINPLDNHSPPSGAGEDATVLDFSQLVQAVDFDGDITPLVSGSFMVDVIDDVPVAHTASATMASNAASATITLTDHVDFTFGADGPGTVTFDTAHAHFTTDPTSGHLALPTAGQYTVNGDSITLTPGSDFQALTDGQTAVLDIPYSVTDHDGDTATGDILLAINGVSPPPVASNDTIFENYATNTTFLIPVAGLLANDSDPNATVNLIAGASFSDATHQFVSFTSPANSSSFTYSITDANGTSGPATVTVDHVTDALSNHVGNGGSFVMDAGNDSLVLGGGNGNDVLVAGSSTSTVLNGNNSNDLLFTGSNGSFTLDGGNGNDTLYAIGTSASDSLTGGNGNDVFAFLNVDHNRTVSITDFVSGTDSIQISAAGFGGGLFSGEVFDSTQFQTAANNAFTNANERFLFDTQNHTLYYSDNGTGAHEVAVAQVTNGSIVHATDMHVVA